MPVARVYTVTDDPAFEPLYVHSAITTGAGDASNMLQFRNEDELEAWQLANQPEIPLVYAATAEEAYAYQHGQRALPVMAPTSEVDMQTLAMVAVGGLLLWRLLGRR